MQDVGQELSVGADASKPPCRGLAPRAVMLFANDDDFGRLKLMIERLNHSRHDRRCGRVEAGVSRGRQRTVSRPHSTSAARSPVDVPRS